MPIDANILFQGGNAASDADGALISFEFGAAVGPLTSLLKIIVDTVNMHDGLLTDLGAKVSALQTSKELTSGKRDGVGGKKTVAAVSNSSSGHNSAAVETPASPVASVSSKGQPSGGAADVQRGQAAVVSPPVRRVPSPTTTPDGGGASRPPSTPKASGASQQTSSRTEASAAQQEDASGGRSPPRRPPPSCEEQASAASPALLDVQSSLKMVTATVQSLQRQILKLQAAPIDKLETDVKALRKGLSEAEAAESATKSAVEALGADTDKKLAAFGKRLELMEIAAVRSVSSPAVGIKKSTSSNKSSSAAAQPRSKSLVSSPVDAGIGAEAGVSPAEEVLSAQQHNAVELAFEVLKRRIDGVEYVLTSHAANRHIHTESLAGPLADVSHRVLALQSASVLLEGDLDRKLAAVRREISELACAVHSSGVQLQVGAPTQLPKRTSTPLRNADSANEVRGSLAAASHVSSSSADGGPPVEVAGNAARVTPRPPSALATSLHPAVYALGPTQEAAPATAGNRSTAAEAALNSQLKPQPALASTSQQTDSGPSTPAKPTDGQQSRPQSVASMLVSNAHRPADQLPQRPHTSMGAPLSENGPAASNPHSAHRFSGAATMPSGASAMRATGGDNVRMVAEYTDTGSKPQAADAVGRPESVNSTSAALRSTTASLGPQPAAQSKARDLSAAPRSSARPASATVRGSFAQALSLGGAPISGGGGHSAKGCVVYKCGWCPAHARGKAEDSPTWERLGQW
jgi:hypothetical protein